MDNQVHKEFSLKEYEISVRRIEKAIEDIDAKFAVLNAANMKWINRRFRSYFCSSDAAYIQLFSISYNNFKFGYTEVEMNYKQHNEKAWNKMVEKGDKWTRAVTSEEVDRARNGDFNIVLTPTKPIPRSWFPKSLNGIKILALASGGGQQGPILAAVGGDVTVFDYSENQLKQDMYVAERDGLQLNTVQGDMMDLSVFDDASFDVIVHPWSNCFISDVNPVWLECSRVLKPMGILMSGFGNPINYIFDLKAMNEGTLTVRHSIPYADTKDLSEEVLKALVLDQDQPVTFGHSLEDQIGGQLKAGFVVTDFYEDNCGGGNLLDKYINVGLATRAVKWRE